MNKPEKEITKDGFTYVLKEGQEKIAWEIISKWYDEQQDWVLGLGYAAGKLAIIAKYLNGDRKPDTHAYVLCLDMENKDICVAQLFKGNKGVVQFVDAITARKAVEILGEEVVRKALNFGSI